MNFTGFDSDSDQDISLASACVDGIPAQGEATSLNQQSNVAVSIHIDHGKVAFFPPSKVSCFYKALATIEVIANMVYIR